VLSLWLKSLTQEQKERDLVIRETIILEAELLLPKVHRFQNMGLEFDAILPYIEFLREQAAGGGIDYKTAATFIIHEINSYRQLGGVQKQLDNHKFHNRGPQRVLNSLVAANASQHLSSSGGPSSSSSSGGPSSSSSAHVTVHHKGHHKGASSGSGGSSSSSG
jgi:uncharacterized membrane protein YgcG